jgi:hypothetical protein
MSRKLSVEELESRIAPSVGLADLLKQLAEADSSIGDLINSNVNPDGSVNNLGDLTDAYNGMGGNQVAGVGSNFNVNNTVLSDSTAASILAMFAKK